MKKVLLFPLVFVVLFSEQLWSQCTDPNAQFEFYTAIPPIPTIFCEGGIVEIDNKCDETNPAGCIDHMTINWDFPFGAVQTFTDFGNRTHTYDFTDSVACLLNLPRTFTIEVCVYYAAPGFDNCITKQVKVRPKPVASFFIDNPICVNTPDQCVINTSCADSMWMWSFRKLPNGIPEMDITEAPCFEFDEVGGYQISLIAKNACGSDTTTRTTQVIDTISAQGTLSQLSGCGMMTVILSDLSSVPPVLPADRTWTITPPTGWMYENSTNQQSQIAQVKFTQPGDYTISLEVEGECNTDSKIIGLVHLAGPPSAQISGVTNGCEPHTINPIANSVDYANSSSNNTISWHFEGGMPESAMGANPGSVQYPDEGDFTVTMTVTNECDTVVYTTQISIERPAETHVQLNGVPASGCGPFTVVLDNTSIGGTPFWWITPANPSNAFSYDNGTSPTSVNPEITFTEPGTYVVHLSLLGVGCGNDTAWTSAPIVVITPPVANLAPIDPNQCTPASITPYSATSNNGGDPNATCHWSFPGGNPNTSNACDPGTIAYPDTGSFTILLITENICGADTADATFYVADLDQVVINAPDTVCSYDAPFTIQATPPDGDCLGFPGCVFDPGSVGQGLHPIVYEWGSGNCAISASKDIYVVHFDVGAGDDEIWCDTFVPVYPLTGFFPPDGSFSGPGVLPGGLFSAAIAGYGPHTITYSYTDDASGCIFTNTKTITVFEPPIAASAIPLSGCVGEPIEFNATSSGTTQCWWNFGEGPNIVQGCETSHTYGMSGDYQVTLVVEDANSCRDTLVQNIHIIPPATNLFSISPLEGCGPLTLSIVNESVGEALEFEWYRDDEVFSTDAMPSPIVLMPGQNDITYTIKLRIVNGCSDLETSQQVVVRPQPVSAIGTNLSTYCSGDPILLANNSYGNADTYLWYRNGALISTDSIPPLVQWLTDEVETVEICLVTTNECGADTMCVYPVVQPANVNAFFHTDTTQVCVGQPVCFTNLSSPWANVEYDFGDGSGSVAANPCHEYAAAGEYLVVLKAVGCGYDSFTVLIRVHPLPTPAFSYLGTPCPGKTFQFTNNSDNGADYLWRFGDGETSTQLSPAHAYEQAGDYTVCLIVTSEFLCRDSICQIISVEDNPMAGIASVDSLCVGDAAVFTSQFATGITSCVWTFSDGFFADGCTVSHAFLQSGDFIATIEVENAFGCRDTAIRLVHVRPTPEANFTYQITEPCAPGAKVIFTNASTGETGLRWYIDGLFVQQAAEFEHTFTAPGEHLVRLVASNGGICEHEVAQTVQLQERPGLVFDLQYPCEEKVTDLLINVTAPGTYDAEVFNDSYFMEGVQHDGLLDGAYQVSVMADNGCQTDTTLTLVAPPQLNILLTPDSSRIILGESVQLQVETNLGNETITWNPSEWLSDPTAFDPIAMPFRTITYFAAVISERGCTKTDTAFIEVVFEIDSSLYIPNIFTPNADGRNDVFRLRSNYPAVSQVKLFQVFARGGQVVFEAKDFDPKFLPPEAEWDGTFNGEKLPPGSFAWLAEVVFFGGDLHIFKGEVILAR